MTLIKCKECKKEVSETTKKCPNCGNDIILQVRNENFERIANERKEFDKKIAKWNEEGVLCKLCMEGKFVDGVCNNCGKSRKDNRIAKFISTIVISIPIIIVIWIVICILNELNEPYTEEELEQAGLWSECSNRSNTYYKCSWDFSEDRCTCEAR